LLDGGCDGAGLIQRVGVIHGGLGRGQQGNSASWAQNPRATGR
jgi:hypothetical protein